MRASVAMAGLGAAEGLAGLPPREVMAWISRIGARGVQLDASLAGLKPRELDGSGRREVTGVLRRLGLELSGIDLWIPPGHFASSDRVSRAVEAVEEAMVLAADLTRSGGGLGRQVCVTLPRPIPEDVGQRLEARSVELGVILVDFGPAEGARPGLGRGIDPAAVVMRGADPAQEVLRGGFTAARLSDADGVTRCAVGEGRLDVLRYRVGLEMAGVSWVVVDARQVGHVDRAVRGALAAWGEQE